MWPDKNNKFPEKKKDKDDDPNSISSLIDALYVSNGNNIIISRAKYNSLLNEHEEETDEDLIISKENYKRINGNM